MGRCSAICAIIFGAILYTLQPLFYIYILQSTKSSCFLYVTLSLLFGGALIFCVAKRRHDKLKICLGQVMDRYNVGLFQQRGLYLNWKPEALGILQIVDCARPFIPGEFVNTPSPSPSYIVGDSVPSKMYVAPTETQQTTNPGYIPMITIE